MKLTEEQLKEAKNCQGRCEACSIKDLRDKIPCFDFIVGHLTSQTQQIQQLQAHIKKLLQLCDGWDFTRNRTFSFDDCYGIHNNALKAIKKAGGGEMIECTSKYGITRKYIKGHNNKNKHWKWSKNNE
jgi:hypothetical protein